MGAPLHEQVVFERRDEAGTVTERVSVIVGSREWSRLVNADDWRPETSAFVEAPSTPTPAPFAFLDGARAATLGDEDQRAHRAPCVEGEVCGEPSACPPAAVAERQAEPPKPEPPKSSRARRQE